MTTMLYVILFLCIFILTALGVIWLSSRKKKEETQDKEERILDIKEPVYSFVECFKSNPKRFKLKVEKDPGRYTNCVRFNYELRDTQTERTFAASRTIYSYRYNAYGFNNYPEYLSQDEIHYIFKELSSVYEARRKKLQEISQIRAKRKADKEREQLMKDYCGGVE